MQIEHRERTDLWIVQKSGVILGLFSTQLKAAEFLVEKEAEESKYTKNGNLRLTAMVNLFEGMEL